MSIAVAMETRAKSVEINNQAMREVMATLSKFGEPPAMVHVDDSMVDAACKRCGHPAETHNPAGYCLVMDSARGFDRCPCVEFEATENAS